MCGIWGVVNIASQQMADAAARAMRHRGPDDYGTYVTTHPVPVSLVNTRLAIIDLSPAGHQPMTSEEGRYWIVYNGEVYNFAELRALLIDAGHRFASHTDTEVILHAYQQWGERCVEYFRGMFAFAVWDTVEARLFAARDRLGIKPLYYVQGRAPGGERTLAFSSELKALLATDLASPTLNGPALHHYLSFYSVPSPYSILQGVETLPPGHSLTYQDGRVSLRQYWNIPAPDALPMTEEEITHELRRLLEESIRLRMIADVPVGAFLSGGVDSSAVVALMTRASGERLKTFSIGFGQEGATLDERSAARVLANHYHTDHTEVIVTGQDVLSQMDAIIRAMDQPTGDGLNTYLVSQATARHVKVALSGLGGDELFAGYPQFRMFQQAAHAARIWRGIPSPARALARGITAAFAPTRRVVTWLEGDLLDRYERVRILFDEQAKLALYTPDTIFGLGAPDPSRETLSRYVHPGEHDPVIQLTRLELQHYMANTLLRDTDAMSMAHSLEVRVPLIDHRLVEFASRIPPTLKLREGRTKWIFAHALQDVLPPEVVDRPKRGFEMPVASWMQMELREIVEDTLSEASVLRRGLFRPEQVRAIYQAFLNGNGPYLRVWALVVLELWMRAFIDGRGRTHDA